MKCLQNSARLREHFQRTDRQERCAEALQALKCIGRVPDVAGMQSELHPPRIPWNQGAL